MYLYMALDITPDIDCFRVGAVPITTRHLLRDQEISTGCHKKNKSGARGALHSAENGSLFCIITMLLSLETSMLQSAVMMIEAPKS